MPETFKIDVVHALTDCQTVVTVQLDAGSTVADALAAAAATREFQALDVDLSTAPVGVYGEVVGRDRRLGAADRVEILRPLRFDPRERRRELAAAGRTMTGARRVRR